MTWAASSVMHSILSARPLLVGTVLDAEGTPSLLSGKPEGVSGAASLIGLKISSLAHLPSLQSLITGV